MNRRGVALAISLLALTTVSFLVAAGFFIAVREYRLGFNTVRLQQSLFAAEAGLADALLSWDPGTYNQLPLGSNLILGRTDAPGGVGWYRASVQRLSESMFLVLAEGFTRDSAGRQRLGQLVQLRPVNLDPLAALESRGPVAIAGSATISGIDRPPAGWRTCASPNGALPALRVAPSDSVSVTGGMCSGGPCLDGAPPVARDSSVPGPVSDRYGGVDWQQLISSATKTIPPGSRMTVGPSTSMGRCQQGAPDNWGDPSGRGGACDAYFPVVSAPGDLDIGGGLGQGILLVGGDLILGGDFRFTGAIIVRGRLTIGATGAKVEGAVITSATELVSPQSFGGTVISYSSCGLNRVLKASARGATLRERAWFHAY